MDGPAMFVRVAQLVVIASGLWLIFAGVVALVRPATAIGFVARMGSTLRIHWTEHLLRGVAGLALMLADETARVPSLFLIGGGFVLASSVMILLAPRDWHARYARSAAARLGPGAMRLLAPLSVAGGVGLIWAT